MSWQPGSYWLPAAVPGVKSAETAPPEDFNFILKYGVGAKNVLDTFAGTFTKDLVNAGTVTTRLTLTPEEMAAVYAEMRRLNIFAYPEEFAPRQNGLYITPHPTYYLKVQMDGKVKEIYWEDITGEQNLSAQPQEAVQSRNLIEKIVRMIEAKEELSNCRNRREDTPNRTENVDCRRPGSGPGKGARR